MYSYVDFELVISPDQEGKHGFTLKVECTKPDGGVLPPTAPQWSTASVARLMPAETAEQRVRLGDMLGSCMFPPPVLAAVQEELAALPEGKGIRIRLRCNDAEMAHWPWELVRAGLSSKPRPSPSKPRQRYLLRDERFSLVRVPRSARPVEPPEERQKLSLLVLNATRVRHEAVLQPDFPAGLPRQDSVLATFDRHPTRESIDDFIDGIVGGPLALDIFHFTGHGIPPRGGRPGGLLLYRSGDRGEQAYPGTELAARLARAGTSLAFVNACFSDDRPESGDGPGLAQALAEIVPVVLAIRGAVGDEKARDFADAFYTSLLAGSTVDEAVARGRLEMDESEPDWQRAVLYSRATTGRFLEPAAALTEPAYLSPSVSPTVHTPPPPQPTPEAIRRWAMVSGPQSYWQLAPGNIGPEFRRVDSMTAADIGLLRKIGASLVISADARVVAELNGRRLAMAWVDRALPGVDPWPKPFELPLDEEPRLLAVAVDFGDEVVCLLSTDEASYRAEVSPNTEPVLTQIFEGPSRCAAIVAGSTLAVDGVGGLRGWELNLSGRGIADVYSIDAARSAGRAVYAVAGYDGAGEPLIARGGSIDTLAALPGTSADEVVVVRQLSNGQPPEHVLLNLGGRLEQIGMVGPA